MILNMILNIRSITAVPVAGKKAADILRHHSLSALPVNAGCARRT